MSFFSDMLLSGYFPKELPPCFSPALFSAYSRTQAGKSLNKAFRDSSPTIVTKPVQYFFCTTSGVRRSLSICHPGSYAYFAHVVAKDRPRLLQKANISKISRSNLKYSKQGPRCITTRFFPKHIAREKYFARSGSRYVVQADVNSFYPSLYTHAVGWAIDPRLRKPSVYLNHTAKRNLLGNKIDQQLMNSQAKYSQGIPIGTDISLLLGEIVLNQVDKKLNLDKSTAFRWIDDYEIGCETLEEAEEKLAKLEVELAKFNLKLNQTKTKIVKLPQSIDKRWHTVLTQSIKTTNQSAESVSAYFDLVFALYNENPDSGVLTFAVSTLFKFKSPLFDTLQILQSLISQCILAEPACTQKAFALFAFWKSNGAMLNDSIIIKTIDLMIERHRYRGLSNDICWALYFCLEWNLTLSDQSSKSLSKFSDDCIAIICLHMRSKNLLTNKFTTKEIQKVIDDNELKGEHWLLIYESSFHGWLTNGDAKVLQDPFFCELKSKNITFYVKNTPNYASIIHPGSAPPWVSKSLIETQIKKIQTGGVPPAAGIVPAGTATVQDHILSDLTTLESVPIDIDEIVQTLLRGSLRKLYNELIAVEHSENLYPIAPDLENENEDEKADEDL